MQDISKKISLDFSGLDIEKIPDFFKRIIDDKRMRGFFEFYNETVLDKKDFTYGTFKYQWGIQGMKKETMNYFNSKYRLIKEEIINENDIIKFYENHCTDKTEGVYRKEGSFCSKLFHTYHPDETPPMDNPIRGYFELQNVEFIKGVVILREGYQKAVEENKDYIGSIRKKLDTKEFSFLRINELSDIRILDLFYWYKTNY